MVGTGGHSMKTQVCRSKSSAGRRRSGRSQPWDRVSAERDGRPAPGAIARWFGSCFYACGRAGLPAEVSWAGTGYVLAKVLKYDFVAGTGLYQAVNAEGTGPRRVVCKQNRRMHFCLLPLGWLGRLVTYRELRNLKRCEGISGVPQVLARLGPTTYLYEYIEGRSLDQHPRLPSDFFERLLAVLQQIHDRGLVHLDLNKWGNIIAGDDGRAWIIDFQVSTYIGDRLLLSKRLSRRLRRWLQAFDTYHLYKHKRRFLPNQLTEAEERLSRNNSLPLRVHRAILRPYRQVRHCCLRYLLAKGVLHNTGDTKSHTETNPARWME